LRRLPAVRPLAATRALVKAWRHRCREWAAGIKSDMPGLERRWLRRWDHLPQRRASADFTRADYAAARARAREVARATLGEALWAELQEEGYLDIPSKLQPGLTYRLRVGRRIEVLCDPDVDSPWDWPYLCINPTYPLPEEEFFAHLYLYVRDREDIVRCVAAPQPRDQSLGRTF